MKPHALVF
ncbi:unnamed protein product [Cuscuta europaea]|uniref:Uncharacterized protein n=1 Tax=Cuscuta europaea TaxID=41803 RepID=A0A9P0ZN57_CUSEU|nr:unnamed protein product [Cuscuta europaea]